MFVNSGILRLPRTGANNVVILGAGQFSRLNGLYIYTASGQYID